MSLQMDCLDKNLVHIRPSTSSVSLMYIGCTLSDEFLTVYWLKSCYLVGKSSEEH